MAKPLGSKPMDKTSHEQQLLQTIDGLKTEWIELHHRPQRKELKAFSKQWDSDWNQLQAKQRERKLNRDLIRSTLSFDNAFQHQQITDQSQQDSLERRQFKHRRCESLADLTMIVTSYDERIQVIQKTRKSLSRELSDLLQRVSLTPLSRPFLILYEDAQLLAIDKPAGLLSVPGRTSDRQDSVQRYLQQDDLQHPNHQHRSSPFKISAIHRLDQDTSGILLFAKDPATLQTLQQQFEHRKVQKTYEAILEPNLSASQICSSGTIDLPLWGDPENRPYQQVNHTYGRQAITQFQVLSDVDRTIIPTLGTRIQFTPLTGRSHQLRVHAAALSGLNNPILGDRLYGTQSGTQSGTLSGTLRCDRLYLHATSCVITHQGRTLRIVSPAPF